MNSMPVCTKEEIPVKAVNVNGNVRKILKKDPGLKTLADSIGIVGVQVPIAVSLNDNGAAASYTLIYGGRRLMASRIAKKETIPALVYPDISKEQAFEIMYWENRERVDLTPVEELNALATYITMYGTQVAADKLNLPPYRTKILAHAAIALTPEWRKALGDPDHPYADVWKLFSLGHIAAIARLTEQQQNQVLADAEDLFQDWRYDKPDPADKFESELLSSFRCKLSAKSWKDDDADLFPDAGACADCRKRSDCKDQIELFESDQKEDPLCLDTGCFDKKTELALRRDIGQATEADADTIVVSTDYSSHNQLEKLSIPHTDTSRWEKCKKDDPKAKPCVKVTKGNVGKLCYVRPSGRSTAGTAPSTAGKTITPEGKVVTPLKDRRAAHDSKRLYELLPKIEKVVAEMPMKDTKVWKEHKHAGIHALVVIYGTKNNRAMSTSYSSAPDSDPPYPMDDESRTLVAMELDKRDLGPGAFLSSVLSGMNPVQISEIMWVEVRRVLVTRLRVGNAYGKTQVPKEFKNEAADQCALLGLDFDGLWKDICDRMPEPKSWANLNTDGTKKDPNAKLLPKKKGKKDEENPESGKKEVGDPGTDPAGPGKEEGKTVKLEADLDCAGGFLSMHSALTVNNKYGKQPKTVVDDMIRLALAMTYVYAYGGTMPSDLEGTSSPAGLMNAVTSKTRSKSTLAFIARVAPDAAEKYPKMKLAIGAYNANAVE